MQFPEVLENSNVETQALDQTHASLVIKFLEFCKTLETQTVQCCIFLDEHNRAECIPCHSGHYISREALQPFVMSESQKTIEDLQNNEGKLKCPLCPAKFRDQDLAMYCNSETYEQYNKMRNRYLYQVAFEKVCADLEGKEQKDIEAAERKIMHEAIRNQFKTAEGAFTGFQCPICFYGPIDKLACDDLVAHHGQVIKPGVVVNNACPMCFFYTQNSNQWNKWEGEFLDGERLEKTTVAIVELTAPFDKYKEETTLRLTELQIMKKGLGNDSIARQCFLDQISGHTQEEVEEEFSIDDLSLETIDDPEDLRTQIENSTDAEQKQTLGSRMIVALRNRKMLSRNCKSKAEYTQIVTDIKTLTDGLTAERTKMEASVAQAVGNLGF